MAREASKAFVDGGGSIINLGLGIPVSLSATILATMAVLFAATTMDTGIRLQRFVVQEAAELMGIKVGKFVATIVVLIVGMGLAFGAGADGAGGMVIWPLFGTTNQLLAGLTLAILAVILLRKRRNVIPILIPLVFVMVMSRVRGGRPVGDVLCNQELAAAGSRRHHPRVRTLGGPRGVIAMGKARSGRPESDDEDRVAAREDASASS